MTPRALLLMAQTHPARFSGGSGPLAWANWCKVSPGTDISLAITAVPALRARYALALQKADHGVNTNVSSTASTIGIRRSREIKRCDDHHTHEQVGEGGARRNNNG